MIEDIAVGGEFFDSDFFTYREDADVAWRAQLLGWKCLYDPTACGYHVRKLRPGMRRQLAPEINMHSVKNRFLMRIKNITPKLYFGTSRPSPFETWASWAYRLVAEFPWKRSLGPRFQEDASQEKTGASAQARRRRLSGSLVPLQAGQRTLRNSDAGERTGDARRPQGLSAAGPRSATRC
jgi:hypothetical protein